jgi:sulfur relay (sulfurtransferase) DsrC/TusE family protein
MSSSVISESARQNIPSITDVIHAVQFVRKMRGGSQPALIRCDDGKLYVVKFFNNPQGPNVLANEVLGNELLNVLHLPSPQWKMVFISRSFIKKNTGIFFETHSGYSAIESGLHFGSEFLGDERTGQVYEWLPNAFCSRVANSKDFLGISIFDVWTNHCDHRQSLYTTGDGNASFLAVFIDNGHLFGGPEWTRKSRQGESLSLDKRFHSNEWSAEVAESWIARFETECASSLFKIIQLVPRFWYSGDINQVAEFLIRRLSILRAFLSEELTRKRMIFNLSHVDLTDARLSLHRFESPFPGNLKKRPALRVAS